MSIHSYDTLKDSIRKWSHRSDLDPEMDNFVILAEAMIDKDLRVREMEKRTTIVVDDAFVEFPDDYLEMRALHLLSAGKRRAIPQITPQQLDVQFNMVAGRPQAFAVHGNQLEFRPAADGSGSPPITYDAEISYFARVEPLIAAFVNPVLLKYPMLYFAAAMVQVNIFLQDDDEQARWTGQYQTALQSANKTSQHGRYNVPTVFNT